MRKILRISRHEFLKIVGKRGFWLGTLAFPLMIIAFAILWIFVIMVVGEDAFDAVGFVDYSGLLPEAESMSEGGIVIRPFANESAAREALEEEEIQGYYVLENDYVQTHAVSLYVRKELPSSIESSFQFLLRKHLLATTDETVRQRVLDGADFSVHTIGKSNDDAATRTMVKAGILFVAFIAIMFVLGDIASYSSMIVEDERENRTLEIMITTLTPNQFIIGKIVGLIGVTLTRPSVWLLMMLPFLFALFLRIPPTYRQMIDWSFVLLIILFLVPGITLFFGLMTVASVVVDDPRYSGQMGSLLSTVLIFSMFVGFSLLVDEDSALVLFFSFFPLTSFTVIVMRQTMTDVPIWQISLSWLILVASAAGSLWLAVRFFKSGRLFTGRPFQWRTIWQKLRMWRSA